MLVASSSPTPVALSVASRLDRLASLLAIGVYAMTASGHDSFAAIAEWVRRADHETLRRLGLPLPSATAVPTSALCAMPTHRYAPDGVSEREQRRVARAARLHPAVAPRRRAYAVDGKCLRGVKRPDGSRVFVPLSRTTQRRAHRRPARDRRQDQRGAPRRVVKRARHNSFPVKRQDDKEPATTDPPQSNSPTRAGSPQHRPPSRENSRSRS